MTEHKTFNKTLLNPRSEIFYVGSSLRAALRPLQWSGEGMTSN